MNKPESWRIKDANDYEQLNPGTPIFGRDEQIDDIKQLVLAGVYRIISLTGPGGVGKTRVAVRVIEELREEVTQLRDNSLIVSLASLHDWNLVVDTIAQHFERIPTTGHLTSEEFLVQILGGKRFLLLLDNFEHLLKAAPAVARLVAKCPKLVVIVTSRAYLDLRGEHPIRVEALPVPEMGQVSHLDLLRLVPSVQMLSERMKSNLQVTEDNAEDIIQVCRRLEGVPLALELVAAQVKRFSSLGALLSRLDHSLSVLRGGSRDMPERQRTIRATVEWSYGLLDREERELFHLLGIFRGGATPETIEVIARNCSLTGDMWDLIASLVDQNLVRKVDQNQSGFRLTMLETVREYAQERLESVGLIDKARHAHAMHYLSLVAEAPVEQWDHRLIDIAETEIDNLRSAFRWMTRVGLWEEAARLTAALEFRWMDPASMDEGASWQDQVVDRPQVSYPTRVLLRAVAARMYSLKGDDALAYTLWEKNLADSRKSGDRKVIADSLHAMFDVYQGVDNESLLRRKALLTEACEIFAAIADEQGVGRCLIDLGLLSAEMGYAKDARRHIYRGVELLRNRHLGLTYYFEALSKVSQMAEYYPGYEKLYSLVEEGIKSISIRGSRAVAAAIEWGAVSHTLRSPLLGAVLSGAAVAHRESCGLVGETVLGARYILNFGRNRIGNDLWLSALVAGKRLSAETALSLALNPWSKKVVVTTGESVTIHDKKSKGVTSTRSTIEQYDFTPTEVLVLQLLAQGITASRRIAENLGGSSKNADGHIQNIMGKIDVHKRAEVALFARRHFNTTSPGE